jgi:hypothetical protein
MYASFPYRTVLNFLISYSGGPLIALEKRVQGDEVHAKFVHDVPVCIDCRQKRLIERQLGLQTVAHVSEQEVRLGHN